MIIGIDISQLAFEGTGVAGYLENLIKSLLKVDKKNKYILFYSSFRRNLPEHFNNLRSENVSIKIFKYPPKLLDFFWNRLHILPIESFIGNIDIFITSDWTEPPTKRAKKATILYDLIVYKYPRETDQSIIDTQKRKLKWVKKESSVIFCISRSTLRDSRKILEIPQKKLFIAYPAVSKEV